MRTRVVIGAFPPPVHGMALINQRLVQALARDGREVRFINLARRGLPGSTSGLAAKLLNGLAGLLILMRLIRDQRPICHLALSGGWGQLLELPFILLARNGRTNLILHHHSFAYLNRTSWLSRLTCKAAGTRSRHVVLCHHMGELLQLAHGIEAHRRYTLSNAAFVDPCEGGEDSQVMAVDDAPLTIGFLGNITQEKGILTFFNLIERLVSRGQQTRTLVAGPILDPGLDSIFYQRLRDLPQAEYLGPLDEAGKLGLFRRLHLLVFPSDYINEAEPVTILEALAQGVPVYAIQRGCIEQQLGPLASRLTFPSQNFVPLAAEAIERELCTAAQRAKMSRETRARFYTLRTEALEGLRVLMDESEGPDAKIHLEPQPKHLGKNI